MRLYLLYLLTAVTTSWIVLFLLGVSAGFANHFPVLALLGSVVMFTIAAPIVVYNMRLGLILGLISYLLILPYILLFTKGVLDDGFLHAVTALAILPLLLVLFGIYYNVMLLRTKIVESPSILTNRIVKLLLSSVPVGLFLLYLILYGQYWSWENFKVA